MKKIVSIAVVAMTLLTACNGNKLKEAENENAELKNELSSQAAIQDSLLILFNDISDGMAQIKDLEKIISSPANLSEGSGRKDQIRNDMIAIQQALQDRRQRLEELETKLKKISGDNTTLTRTIQNLKAQIADQQTEIATLTNQLAAANIKIEQLGTEVTNLNTAVDSLNTGIANERQAREKTEAENVKLDKEANVCYYAIGTKKELKDKKIVESGFLRKTKIMKGDFDTGYFTQADRRTLTSIPLHSSKAKVLTSQSPDSYQIVDEGGQKVLKITNPAKFWQLNNYLVIKVD